MDVLKNKSRITYAYISRYANFPFYYHSLDKKFVYGMTNQLSLDTAYVEVTVNPEDTLDKLANDYYGRPDYYCLIADFNRIQDPFIKLSNYYQKIKIPALASIQYEE